MSNIKEFQNKIFQNPDGFWVDVYDRATLKNVQKVDAAFLGNFNKDLSVYLNSIKNKHPKVSIRPRLKRGNSAVNAGHAIELNLTQATAATPKTTMAQAQPQNKNTGNDLLDFLGLKGDKIMDNALASRENVKLEKLVEKLERQIEGQTEKFNSEIQSINNKFSTELAAVKSKRNKYRKKCDVQDREIERLTKELEAEPTQVMQLAKMAFENPGSVPALMGAFSGLKGATPPATQPTPEENYSDEQKHVFDTIKKFPTYAQEFSKILARYEQGDDEFVTIIREQLNPLKKVADE